MNPAPEKSEQEAIPAEFGTRALAATHRRCFSEPKQAFPPPSRRDEIPDAFPRLSHSSGRNRRGRVPQRQIRWFVQFHSLLLTFGPRGAVVTRLDPPPLEW